MKPKAKAAATPVPRADTKGKGKRGAEGGAPPPAAQSVSKIIEGMAAGLSEPVAFTEGYAGISLRLRGVISTRCDELDKALGHGGIPQGRLTILSGADGSGKTTQALELVAEVQALGGLAGYIDAEHKLDLPYAERIGVQLDSLMLAQPYHAEGMFEVAELWIRAAAGWREMYGDVPIAIFLDSLNAAVPKAEIEGDWDKIIVGGRSRFFSSKLPKLIGMAQRAGVTLIFIGQLRDKIGIMFGKKTDISGGRSLKHHATCIVNYSRTGKISSAASEAPVAIKVRATVDKNQVALPFREANFVIRLGYGIDREAALVDAAVSAGVIEKAGNWCSFEGERIGNGVEQVAGFLRKDPSYADRIREAVHNAEDKESE